MNYFLISLLVSYLTHWLFSRVLLNYRVFKNLPNILLLLISSLFLLWLEKICWKIPIFEIYYDFLNYLLYGSLWKIFQVHLKRWCILQLSVHVNLVNLINKVVYIFNDLLICVYLFYYLESDCRMSNYDYGYAFLSFNSGIIFCSMYLKLCCLLNTF